MSSFGGGLGSSVSGGGGAAASGTANSPGATSKLLTVDVKRTDTYTADGSARFPFKTISAALAQIIANADGATNPYVIVVCPGTYPEAITLNSALIHNISFTSLAYDYQASDPVILTGGINSTSNNASLQATFFGFRFSSALTITGALAFNFFGCWFDGSAPITSNTTTIEMSACVYQSTITDNSSTYGFNGCQLFDGIIMAGTSSFFLERGTQLVHVSGSITIPTGCFLGIRNGRIGANVPITVQNGGQFQAQGSVVLSSITINAGAIVQLQGSWTVGFTGVAPSQVDGLMACGAALLGVVAPTAPAGMVTLGSTTAATATAGAAALPANPVGFLIINVAGTVQKIPYYNN